MVFVVIALVYNIAFKTPVYSTSTTVVLVKDESSSTTDTINQNDITLNQKLVSTYRQIIKSRLVLEQVIEKLKLDYTYEDIYDEVNVTSVDETEIIKVIVTDENPSLAVEIANEIASVFDTEVKQIYNISNVSIIDKAVLPKEPSNDHIFRDAVLALMIAFAGCSAVIFIVFYFDDTIRDVDNIENELGMVVVAKVFKDDNNVDLIVDRKPNASSSESIRTLRTNLQFESVDTELKTLLVTSSLPGEGKSFVAANLGAAFAQAGKRVLIVDCDLRKGRQHRIFKVSSKDGLSNLLINDINDFGKYITETRIDNLYLIPRGTFPPNPSELLNSKKNKALFEKLKVHFDIIIIDGAPIIGLADSLILSSMVDKVLLVASINNTPKSELLNTKKNLENVGANIAGVVANNVVARKGHYGNYYYYYGYTEDNTRVKKEKKEKEDK